MEDEAVRVLREKLAEVDLDGPTKTSKCKNNLQVNTSASILYAGSANTNRPSSAHSIRERLKWSRISRDEADKNLEDNLGPPADEHHAGSNKPLDPTKQELSRMIREYQIAENITFKVTYSRVPPTPVGAHESKWDKSCDYPGVFAEWKAGESDLPDYLLRPPVDSDAYPAYKRYVISPSMRASFDAVEGEVKKLQAVLQDRYRMRQARVFQREDTYDRAMLTAPEELKGPDSEYAGDPGISPTLIELENRDAVCADLRLRFSDQVAEASELWRRLEREHKDYLDAALCARAQGASRMTMYKYGALNVISEVREQLPPTNAVDLWVEAVLRVYATAAELKAVYDE